MFDFSAMVEMWRYTTLVIAFSFLGVSAQPNQLSEICKDYELSEECHETSLDCQDQYIGHLEISMMRMTANLECLSLYNTHLTSIQQGVFETTSALRYLDLQGNLLSHLDSAIFSKLTQLEYLNLSNNSLTSLTDEIFKSQSKLKMLILSGNQISHISMRVLAPLKSLTLFYIYDNPFHCDCQALEVLSWCRTRGFNTSATCREPKQLEGLTWDAIEKFSDCHKNLGLTNFSSAENNLKPRSMEEPHCKYLPITLLFASLAFILFILLCLVIAFLFLMRKNKNKVMPQTDIVEYEAKTCDGISGENTTSVTSTRPPSNLYIKNKVSYSSLEEESKDAEVIIKDNSNPRESKRHSGEYDNICLHGKFQE